MSSTHEQASAESPREIGATSEAGTAPALTRTVNDTLALTRSVVSRLPRPSAREIRDTGGLDSTHRRTHMDSLSSTRSSDVGELINQLQRLWQRQRFRADERAFTRDVDKIIMTLMLRAPPHEDSRTVDGYSSGSGGETSALLVTPVDAVMPIDGAQPTSHQQQEDDSMSDADSSSDEGNASIRTPRSPADASVEILVDAMDPLFRHRYQEVRSLAFEVVNLCVTHYGSQLTKSTRRLVFDRLQHHDQGGDFEPRQRTLRSLTNDGRHVEPFEDDVGWLLIDWLEESNEQRDLLNLIQSILRRSPLSLNFDSVIAITSVICGRCDVAWARGDLESCKRYLAFFHVLATHRLERALATSVCLRTLCWMVNADGHGTWSVMKHLLSSSAGFQILRGLVTMLESPMQYSQWILRGAVFFVGMSCWGSQRVAKLDEIKWAPILLALEACLASENGVVVFEIILAIQRLVKKYGDKNGHPSTASDTPKPPLCRRLLVEWDIILRMLRTLQPWLSKTNGPLGKVGEDQSTAQDQRRGTGTGSSPGSSSTRKSQPTSQVRTDVPVHMTRIPKELLDTLQVVVDLVRDGKFGGEVDEFYDVLQDYFAYLPESAVRLLLRHRAEAAHPAHHVDWLCTLEETMAQFFVNRDAPPSIRHEALELLQINLRSSRNVCEDRVIEEVLLPTLTDVYADPDPTIRRKALDLVTEVARTLESVRFDSLLDILENAVHVSSNEDAQVRAMAGIVSLFSSYFNHLPHSRAIRMYDIITSVVESHRNWQVRLCAMECLLKVCEASSDFRLQWRENHVRTSRFLFCSRRGVRNQPTIPVAHGLRALLTRISTETHSTLFRMAVEGLRRMLYNRLILVDIDISDMAMKLISYVDYHAFGRAAIPDEISTLLAEIEAEDPETIQAGGSKNRGETEEKPNTRSQLPQTSSSTRINPATAKSNLHEACVLLCKTRFTTLGLQILELFVSYMDDLDVGTRHHLVICCVGVVANPLIVSEKDIAIKHTGSDSTSTHSDSGWIWSTRASAASLGHARAGSRAADDPCEQTAFQPTSYHLATPTTAKPVSPQMAFTSRVLSKLQSSAHSSSLFNVLTTTQATVGLDKRSAGDEAAFRATEAMKHEREMVVKCLRLVFDAEIEMLRTAVNTISLLGHLMPSVVSSNLDMLLQSAKTCFYTPEGEFRGDGYAAVVEMIGNLVVSTPGIVLQLEHKARIVFDVIFVAFQRHTDKTTSYLAYRVLCEIVFRCERREDRVALASAALPLLSEYRKGAATNHKATIIEAAIDFLTCFALSRSDLIPAPALRVSTPYDSRPDHDTQSKSTRSWVHHNAIVSIESRAGKPASLIVRRASSTTTWHLAMQQPFIVHEPTDTDQSELEVAAPDSAATETATIKVMMPTEAAADETTPARKPTSLVPPRPPVPRPSRTTVATRTSPGHVLFSPHHLPVPPLPAYDGIGGSPSFFRDAAPVDDATGLAGMEQMLLDAPNPMTIEKLEAVSESGDSTADDDANKENTSHATNDNVQQSELSVSPTITEQSDAPTHSSESHEDDQTNKKGEERPLLLLNVNAAGGLLSAPEGTDSLFLMMQLFNNNMEDRPQILAEGASLALGLSVLDRTPEFETHKIGVLYWRGGQQQAEVDILGNFGGSLRYLKFLRSLGSVTRLQGLHGFSGGMDTSDQHSDGKYTLLYRSHSLQMVFHVATMMTLLDELNDKEDQSTTRSQQERNAKAMKKKRLIGNDFVHIVFKECDDDYDVKTFSGQFNDVHIIVQPLNDHEYRTTVKCKPGIASFGPLHGTQVIPSEIAAQCVRQTCLNANLACQAFHQDAIGFTMNCEERLKQIKQLGARHATVSDEWTLLHPPATSRQSHS